MYKNFTQYIITNQKQNACIAAVRPCAFASSAIDFYNQSTPVFIQYKSWSAVLNGIASVVLTGSLFRSGISPADRLTALKKICMFIN